MDAWTAGTVMSRRDEAGKATKRRRPKSLKSKGARRPGHIAVDRDGTIKLLTRERDEALEQQTAASEVLQVISSSAGELEPVFQTLLLNATRLCAADFGFMFQYKESFFQLMAQRDADAAYVEYMQREPLRPGPETLLGRIAKTIRPVQILDFANSQAYLDRDPLAVVAVEHGGVRTLFGVPMLRNGELVGAIALYRKEVSPFTEKQIDLLTNFAAQAVIAIENTRLLNELRQRTDDLSHALEQQTATSEVLKVISSSPGELEPVFNTMLAKATDLCGASYGALWLCEGDAFRTAAFYGALPSAYVEQWRVGNLFRLGPDVPAVRAARSGVPVQEAELKSTKAYESGEPLFVTGVDIAGIRTILAVPMLKDGKTIGIIAIYRKEVRPFETKQLELVQNFAAQAVIAIENARLLNELRETLERQTATSEVLKVISSSPGELDPVFQSLLENATRLCGAKFGTLFLREDDKFRVVAQHNSPRALAELRQREPLLRVGSGTSLHRAIATKQVVQIADLTAEPAYLERDQHRVELVELAGYRAVLSVPMLKDQEAIGAINMYREEAGIFPAKQVELLKNFAAQAVIAIENVRLLKDLRQRTNDLSESLEQQTATSEVLRIISGSPTNIQPVLDAVGENAARLCEADNAVVFRVENGLLRQVASCGHLATSSHPEHGLPIDRETVTGRAVFECQTIHVYDLAAEETEYPQGSKHARIDGHRTTLAAPMLREGIPVGAILIRRTEVRPFSEKQVHLVTTFADQAAIAIENVRLFNELDKLNQQLEQRVADQVGEIERMGRLRRFLPPQVADLIVASGNEKQLESHRREITALFCDLRGFTGFSESSDPEDVMALLREYHAAIGRIIIKYSGTLERYAGDGVMVVFNDPVPVENPALQAVLMALEMRAAIGALTGKWQQLGHELGFGIGIAHGFATLGTIGFEGRQDYAAIGTVSNVASRLCDEAKPGQILISPRVLLAVDKIVTVESAGEFALKGIRRPMMAFNVLSASAAKPS
jgi:GAF domain-containing protein